MTPTRTQRSKKTPGRLVIIFIMLIYILAHGFPVGADSASPHPYQRGDVVYHRDQACVIKAAWEDGSAVAQCGTGKGRTFIAFDPEDMQWGAWKGCAKVRQHSPPQRTIERPKRCYGPLWY